MKLINTFILIVALSATMFGQITVSGRVIDSTTGNGVPNATVIYNSCLFPQDAANCSFTSVRSTSTNGFGYFTIPDVWWACALNVLTVNKKWYESDIRLTLNCTDVYEEISLVPSN